MIAMTEKDRDVLRFLWLDDVSKTNPETIVLRFTRVVFGVSSSPFLLNATIRHHLEKYSVAQPDLVNKLLKSTYVDDVVTGAESEEAAYELYKASKELLKSAGFNLRKFTSISQSLESELQLLPPHCFTDSKVALFWIQGVDKDWKPFVQNRVTEIRSLIHPDRWSHCSGRDNPADIPSRGSAPLELSVNVLWRDGPEWLREKQLYDTNSELSMPEDCIAEMKAKDKISHDWAWAVDYQGAFGTGASDKL